jgi:hypothetical protein
MRNLEGGIRKLGAKEPDRELGWSWIPINREDRRRSE